MFWALLGEFSCAIGICLRPSFLSNGKGHFGPIKRNDQTGQSGPPAWLVPNISVGPNRNGPFHLMYQSQFPEFWIEWKAPSYSRGRSLEKLLGVVWSYWVRVKVRVVNFLSRFFFCQNVEHEYFFFTLQIILAIGKNIFFWTSLNLLVREYFLVLFDNFPNNTSLAFGDHSCLFTY